MSQVAPAYPGRATFVQHVMYWSATPISGRFQMNSGNSGWPATGTVPVLDITFACGPNYAAQFDVSIFLRSGDRTGSTTYLTQWLDAGERHALYRRRRQLLDFGRQHQLRR
jgi:hypothetical protein